jgi:cell division protein ZapA
MGRVILQIGDQEYPVACRDGEESRLEMLGAMLAERFPDAQKAAGNAGTVREMLLTALMLADDLADAKTAAVQPRSVDDATLERLAERLEALAIALEESLASA